MTNKPWFAMGKILSMGMRSWEIEELLYCGEDWQIYHYRLRGWRADERKIRTALFVKRHLVDKWMEIGLLPFSPMIQGKQLKLNMGVISSHDLMLVPVAANRTIRTKSDAFVFAHSLRESRKIEPAASFHDAIVVERYQRLLPTWTDSETLPDEEVFGKWLTGGVSIPFTALRKRPGLVYWLETEDISDLAAVVEFDRSPKSEVSSQTQEISLVKGAEDVCQHRKFRLAGRSALEDFFNEHVIDIVLNSKRYKAFGIEFPKPIVLHGPPGCGKTFAVQQLVEYLGWTVHRIDSSTVASPYIHQTSRLVSDIFTKAKDEAPSVVVIDEMEAYLSDRNFCGSAHRVEELAEFLRCIPEASDHQILVIGMTNRLDMIDPAIVRRGRFDHIVSVEMPCSAEVIELVDSLLKELPHGLTIDKNDYADQLAGRPLSDTAFVIHEASRLAVRAGKERIDDEVLRNAIQTLAPIKAKRNPIGFV